MDAARGLLLFDIDGTLLRHAHVEHRAALHAAIRRTYGIPEAEAEAAGVAAAGRTDLEIVREILVLAGVPAGTFARGRADLCVAAAEEYARRVPDDLRDRVAPGVPQLLEALGARPGVRLALLTGNLEAIARMKLRAAGIGRWFAPRQGGFGSDHEDRGALPAIARARAGRGCAAFPRERTAVIGDTPLDVACARVDGVHAIAVAGGPYRVEDLRDADAVVPDALGLARAIDAFLDALAPLDG
jgi:phosphoglycolate phosphatase-like HAD superfamily hydrolase